MNENEDKKVQVRRRIMGCAFGAVTLALGVCVLSAGCSAAGPSGPTRVSELPALLASSNALSEAAMARQTGTGLRPPAIITNEPSGSPKVLLWDELRIGPLIAPATNGIVTGGGTGK
jgi:hypothetical protein